MRLIVAMAADLTPCGIIGSTGANGVDGLTGLTGA